MANGVMFLEVQKDFMVLSIMITTLIQLPWALEGQEQGGVAEEVVEHLVLVVAAPQH